MQIKEREPIDFIHAMMEAVAVKTEVEGIHFRNSFPSRTGKEVMMSEKVYISTRIFPLTDEHRKYLEECAVSGDRKLELVYRAPEEMTEEDLEQAVAAINFFPPALLSKAKKLEWVQLASAGADVFAPRGILPDSCVLTNASGAYSLSVGEHMIAQTFSLCRNFPAYARDQQAHVWGPLRPLLAVEGSTILVLGLGDIGSFYARKMKALGAYLIGVRRHEGACPDCVDEVITTERLEEALPRADIIAMVLPGGKATEHIIGDHAFALMKEGACILNVGRGNAIDPDALMRALDSGKLRGAALDVTQPEPLPKDHPLWDYPNVLITPHSAGWWQLDETLSLVVSICGENLRAFSEGRPLSNVVNRELGY